MSLFGCMRKAGASLSAEDKRQLTDRALQLRADGMSRDAADAAAIDELISAAGDAVAAAKDGTIVVGTKAFDKWFDGGVVPEPVYHGSRDGFGDGANTIARAGPYKPFWVTPQRSLAERYSRAGEVVEMRTNIRNPADLDKMVDELLPIYNNDPEIKADGRDWNEADDGPFSAPYILAQSADVLQYLASKGYDSVTTRETATEVSYGILSPADVKIVAGASGTFDRPADDVVRSAARLPDGIRIVEVQDGFNVFDGERQIGRLRDNLKRGQAALLDESANVDIVTIDREYRGKGIGDALYDAFYARHDGRITPSGITSPDAWAVWKRKFPAKVDEFVEREAARIKDGASVHLVVGNITDPEVAARVRDSALGPGAAKKAFMVTARGGSKSEYFGDIVDAVNAAKKASQGGHAAILTTHRKDQPGYVQGTMITVASFVDGRDVRELAADEDGNPDYDVRRTAFSVNREQENSAEFKKWFDGSKVVDSSGKPLVVYHATSSDFDVFGNQDGFDSSLGFHFGSYQQANNLSHHLDVNGPPQPLSIIPVYLSIKNPLRTKDAGAWQNPFSAWSFIRRGLGDKKPDPADFFAKYGSIPQDFADAAAWRAEVRRKLIDDLLKDGFDGIVYKNRVEGAGDSWIAFRPSQIKSAVMNSGAFSRDEDSINKSVPRVQTDTPRFKEWFAGSKVVDESGEPLVVYRGEHRRGDGTPSTLLPSITFTNDPEVAALYASEPNDSRTFSYAEAPHVIPAYLSIKKPVIDNRYDPFVDMGDVAAKLGDDFAAAMARKHASWIEGTGNWDENFSRNFRSVSQLLASDPGAISKLYMPAFVLLDDFAFVGAAKDAGFDGGIHVGNGESADAMEYRVFDQSQIKSAIGNSGAFSRDDADITRSAMRALPGAPQVDGATGPDPQLVAVAEKYAADNGIPYVRQRSYVEVDEDRARRLAAAYEEMKHAPQDPRVKEAYENLIKQTTAQYKALTDAGYRFWFIDTGNQQNLQYLESPFNAMRDIRATKSMGVFPTAEGFGSGATDLNVDDNPLLADTGFTWPVGGLDGKQKPVLANDLFRAVHDAFGHGLEGAGFRARGEENAWQAHARLFTGSALAALTSETRGQNSWLNFGPHGEANRNAKTEDTIFADQKTGLMPEWTWTEGLDDGARRSVARGTIEVDGVARSRDNADGKPIADSDEKIARFWRWFGGSKVVDKQGRPVVVYHGTDRAFQKVNLRRGAQGLFWFTSDRQSIVDGGVGAAGSGKIMALYAKIDNPASWKQYNDLGLYEFKREGLDGAILRSDDETTIREEGDNVFDGFIIDRPSQIKSADANNGNFDPADDRIKRSAPRPVFYSKLERVIGEVPERLATQSAPQWAQWLKANAGKLGVKQEEVEWSGVTDYLKTRGKDKVTSAELATFVADSGVRVSEKIIDGDGSEYYDLQVEEREDGSWGIFEPNDGVQVGGDYETEEDAMAAAADMEDDSSVNTKYHDYVVPGGENYREVLITLPSRRVTNSVVVDGKRVLVTRESPAYSSGHWDEPNVIAHARVHDVSDAGGNGILFVNEIQSDWAQSARKSGFKNDDLVIKQTNEDRFVVVKADNGEAVETRDGTVAFTSRQAAQQAIDSGAIRLSLSKAPPRAPFVADTKSWVSLVLKRLIVMAAQGGYDKIALINGQQAADMFDLSKQIDRIDYSNNGDGTFEVSAIAGGKELFSEDSVKPGDLEDIVGKEMAKRIIDGDGKPSLEFDPVQRWESDGTNEGRYFNYNKGEKMTLAGIDLKVGGSGMRAFYDQIVPQVARDIVKKIGGKVGEVEFNPAQVGINPDDWVGKVKQIAIVITPEMRAIASEGLPLFSRSRADVESPEFKRWFGDSVITENDRAGGAPLLLYHGTEAKVTTFRPSEEGNFGPGIYLTNRIDDAEQYSGEEPPMQLYVRIERPFRTFADYDAGEKIDLDSPAIPFIRELFGDRAESVINDFRNGKSFGFGAVVSKELKAQGYDGIIVEWPQDRGLRHVIALDANQVKSATDNNGSFSKRSANITRSAPRINTDAFKKWFGESVVTEDGQPGGVPMTVYHGTPREFEGGAFKRGKQAAGSSASLGFHFGTAAAANDRIEPALEEQREFPDVAELRGTSPSIMPVYLSLKKPVRLDDIGAWHKPEWINKALERAGVDAGGATVAEIKKNLQSLGYDGVVYANKFEGDGADSWIVFDPKQIKSAIGNNGDYDPSIADITRSIARLKDMNLASGYKVADLISTSAKVSLWDKTVGTMRNMAKKHPQFAKVYDAVQRFLNDVSVYATRAADLAPSILPRLETLADIKKMPVSAEDAAALQAPIFQGTLNFTRDADGNAVETDDVGLAGVVWKDAELRERFKLNDRQIGLYREFRKAINRSLNDLGVSDMIRYAGKDSDAVRAAMLAAPTAKIAADILENHLADLAVAAPERAYVLQNTAAIIREKANTTNGLIAKGYAPLTRFGDYTVYVTNGDEQVYFGMFESAREMNKMARLMREEFPDAKVETGTMSKESYKLFKGVTPETLALFGESLGLEDSATSRESQVFQEYLKLAKNSRSAMKRMIKRKGVEGFSQDVGRVLAGFVYSNARQTSTNLHSGDILRAQSEIKDGDLKDHAIRMAEYVNNPHEEAQGLRGLLFVNYIGGSIASALVNLTQSATTTWPTLTQHFGIGKATAALHAAMRVAARGAGNDADLAAAMKRAQEEGITDPNETHSLQAQAAGRGALSTGDGTRAGDAIARAGNAMSKIQLVWGRMFGLAETMNRKIAFAAAYDLARKAGREDAYEFAVGIVNDTQFVMNKGNNPQWARGPVGATLFTFRKFMINYLENLARMWGGGPDGKRAFALSLAVLFVLAGASGLPFMSDIDDLVDFFAQRVLNKNFVSKQARKEFFASILGNEAAEIIDKGLSGVPGVPMDVSGRLGLDNVVPGTGFFPKKRDHGSDYKEIAGAAGDFVSRMGTAVGQLAQGDVSNAVQSVIPVAASNAYKAIEMFQLGYYKDAKNRKVIDTTAADAALKAVGFQPNSVANMQQAVRAGQQFIDLVKLRESEIADLWTRGRVERDSVMIADARRQLDEWNLANPGAKIEIDPNQITRRVREANKDKAQRLASTAPKEVRAAVKRQIDDELGRGRQ